MTGWTLKGKELLWGDSEAVKLFSMRETPQVFNTSVIGYSCLIIIFIYLNIVTIKTYVKIPIARGQYAWVDKVFYFICAHQRLNEEYLNKNNKIWFEQCSLRKKIKNLRQYSTTTDSDPKLHTNVCNNEITIKDSRLDPMYVTGLADAESSFYIGFKRRNTNRTGWHLQPGFKIELHYKDAIICKRLLAFWGVGNFRIQENKGRNSVALFVVESTQDLVNVIIPHFDKYKLVTKKRGDYELWKEIVFMIKNKEHLTMIGLRKIISLRASLNTGLTPLLKEHFSDVIPSVRPEVELPSSFNLFWFLGFSEGEGCFYVKIDNRPSLKNPIVTLRFILTQHSRDRLLLLSLIEYLGCGRLEETSSLTRLIISRFEDVWNKVIPIFDKYQLIGEKGQDYLDWKKVALLMNSKTHLTKEGIAKINSIKSVMNVGRVNSDISNTEIDNLSSFSPKGAANVQSKKINSSFGRGGTIRSLSSLATKRNKFVNPELKEIEGDGRRSPNDNFSSLPVVNSPLPPFTATRSIEGEGNTALFKTLSAKAQMESKLVGLTDSDEFDSFIIKRIDDKILLRYSFIQPITNLRLLYHIKKTLGYGKVKKYKCSQIASFSISDLKALKEIIFPIFYKFPLLTRKYYSYLQFKEVWSILDNKSLNFEQKNQEIKNLLSSKIFSESSVSPAISSLNKDACYEKVKSVVSRYWLAGFIEGKANLDIVSEQGVFNIVFSILLKKEEAELLNLIKRVLHIPNKIILEENGHLILKTRHGKSISRIIDLFSSADCKFKGMKSLEFKLWKQAFFYKNTKINKVAKIYIILNRLKMKNITS